MLAFLLLQKLSRASLNSAWLTGARLGCLRYFERIFCIAVIASALALSLAGDRRGPHGIVANTTRPIEPGTTAKETSSALSLWNSLFMGKHHVLISDCARDAEADREQRENRAAHKKDDFIHAITTQSMTRRTAARTRARLA
jgi:hypothetical protein